jgi:Ca2+-binding RTX toxin-like protein
MVLNGTAQAETLTGGADADTLYGYGGNDKLIGNAGDDVLAGMAGNDTLQGGEGDDYLMGGAGNDTLDGGNGVDWAAYEDATAGVTVSLAITTAQNTGGGGSDKLTSIENLYGSAFNDVLTGDANTNNLAGDAGNDTLSGAAGDDNLFGGAGADSLVGGNGDDYIQGGAGNDTIDGGNGVDWAAYDDATSGVTVNLTLTTAQDTGGGGADKLVSVENVYGSAYNDVLTGDAGANYLAGGDGADTLVGGAGDDHLHGGAGSDSLVGGDGFDVVSYDDGRSVGVGVFLESGIGGVPAVGATPGETDRLVSIEAVEGSSYDDGIYGDAHDNYLFGGAGNDSLFGRGGADVVDGGDGNDYVNIQDLSFGAGGRGDDSLMADWNGGTLDGGEGDDILGVDYFNHMGGGGHNFIDGGAGIDTFAPFALGDFSIDLNISGEQSISGQENWRDLYVTLNSIENLKGSYGSDVLIGDAGANRLEGGDGFGFDTLSGGAGMDTLVGGAGKDIMTGGDGKDTFVFAVGDSLFYSPDGTFDVITDFTAADQLKFSDAPLAISYTEGGAASFASALATVNSMLTYPNSFHEYIAFQVGADVYVFSGHADPDGAGLENIIKLANVNLDAISYDNFV